MNRGHKQTDLIIMDFAKAFDKVPHRRLLHKLDYYGIRGFTHKWINSWLSGRSQQVVLDGQASDPVAVLSGVPQGSVLGPILFLIFINDLLDNIKSSVRLFVDDCVLYRSIHSLQDCLILQEDLDSLGLWEADWQMKFNVAKCHSMRVTRHYSHKQIIHDYTLHQQTLENVQSAKYLGITITENMDWGQHISDISSKATNDVIDAFNTTSRYLDDILNINNVYFENMVSQIYPSELQLNKANASDTEAAFLDLHLSISNDIVSTKIYDKRDDFDFEIVNFPFLDGDVPRSTSYGVYISQLIRFARASSYVTDFNTRNKLLTQKLLKQGYRYHKLRKTFSKFYRRYYDLISKFQVGLKSLLRQGLSEPDFYGDLVYKFRRIVGSNNFSAQFIKIISHYKKIGYNINVLQQTACLVVNPITVGNFAFLFNCTPVGRTSDSMMVPT